MLTSVPHYISVFRFLCVLTTGHLVISAQNITDLLEDEASGMWHELWMQIYLQKLKELDFFLFNFLFVWLVDFVYFWLFFDIIFIGTCLWPVKSLSQMWFLPSPVREDIWQCPIIAVCPAEIMVRSQYSMLNTAREMRTSSDVCWCRLPSEVGSAHPCPWTAKWPAQKFVAFEEVPGFQSRVLRWYLSGGKDGSIPGAEVSLLS